MAAKILLQEQRAASIADILSKTKDILAMDLTTAERTRDFLEISWKKFDAENEKLYQASREPPLEHPYFKEKRYEATMQQYFSGLSILHRRIEALAPPASTARRHEQARSRASLPMIELPKFSGSFTDWKPFEDLFSSLVRNDPDISSVEKMHYLRSSLEGEAARVISNLRLSADAFETAWKRLVGRFENKRLLALAHVERLLNLPPVKPRTSHGLHQLVNIIESSLSAIEALGCPVEQWGLIVLQRASSALDPKTREDWEHHLGSSTEIPPYRRLLSFISAAARALEHIESHREHEKATSSRTSRAQRASPARSYAKVLNLAPQSSPRPVPTSQTSQQPAPSKQTSPQRAATPPASQGQSFIPDLSNNCCYCKRQHYLAFCPKFTSLSRKERVEVVTEKRLCFNCLGRHNVRQCRSTRRCNTCGEPYHTLIHPGHLAISTESKASQVRSSSSSIISSATMSSQRLPSSSSTPSLSDAPAHQQSRRRSQRKRSSHIQSSHSRSSSSSTPVASHSPPSSSPSSSHQKSSPPSSSHQKSSPPPSSHKTSQNPRSHLRTILKSSISSSSKSSLSSSPRSSQKVKRVRFSSPISDCDRPSHSSLSSCSRAPVLLATCKAFAISPKGVPTLIRLLIDPGSELTLASSKLVAKLNLKRHPGSIPIQGVGSSSPGATQGQVSLTLQSTYSSSQVNLKALVLPKITSQVPSSVISEQDWPHLRPLRLADPDFLTPKSVDLLIGADNLRRIMKSSRLIMRGDSEPIAFHTRFGWAVLGATASPRQSNSLISCHAISNESLNETLTKFWVQEEVSSCPTPSLSLAESECEKHFVDTHSRLPTGRYVVRLPFSKDISALGHSKSLATKCLQRLLKRFGSDSLLKEKYTDFLREYESLGHMVPVPLDAPEPSHTFYLPHHGVWRNQSSSTKLRVVFNGSAKSSSHVTLNDLMHTGPKTQTDIFDVLLWIRQHKYIFITDIVKMFRQIQVHPQDRDLQRILWVNESSQIQAYQLTTVTYGTRSAPYLACRVLKRLVEDEGHNYPLAIDPILKGSYVDDISGGAESIEQLNGVASQLQETCDSACLPLDKWKSNSRDFSHLSSTHSDLSPVHSFDDLTTKILGISWNSQKDVFTFDGTISFHQAVTKRIILSEVAQLFDPLGLLSPVVIKAKILMQRLWLEKVGWDDELTPDIIHEWSQFRQNLARLSVLETSCWLNLSSKALSVQIHGFSDASQLAMAAVVYLRVSYPNKPPVVRLVCSKTKVAPLKRLTIPRLELSAAALLARLTKEVIRLLDLSEADTFLWSDSSVTLAWVKNNPMRWKEFVGNRVAAIHNSVPQAHWKFISGKLNPADCASRGLSASQLIEHSLWWKGPPWLSKSPEFWPSSAPPAPNTDLEERPGISLTLSPAKSPTWDLIDLSHVSSFQRNLTKLLRITALSQRAISCFKKVPGAKLSISPLNPADLEKAKLFWIRKTQEAYFAPELKSLAAGQSLHKRHVLSRLTAFVDRVGILRVGGRLQNSQLDEDSKHPAILPRQSKFTQLVISDAHARTMHGGTQLTLAYIRRTFWIIGGRAPVKSFMKDCITCARIRGVRAHQFMAPLPTSRVTPSLVFETTGLDYAGPVSLKTFQGRGAKSFKGWIAVFVCFSTSAVHLEVVSDYSTEGFLKAFRRFASRRGIPKTLRSDCGTNFQGADAQLKELFSTATKESLRIQRLLANDGTKWIFNPPGAPHMGGKWEAAVKSIKYHLQRTISDTLFTFEDFSTFLAQVEAVLNSRPLSSLSEDPDDLSALTPGHFIRGEALTTIPEPSLTDISDSRLSHFQRIQERFQQFWKRWSAECLQAHQTTSKWQTSQDTIKKGSLVLISDERFPPSKWPLARVIELHPGKDGLCRIVTVKTATSTITRPIVKLVPLSVPPHTDP
ncbi:hypothetical protein M0802_016545 [Mischocyttarus mexicanus]|nr:hypothetical protein M0802_016545 [Mischocyttarus mexicanus]